MLDVDSVLLVHWQGGGLHPARAVVARWEWVVNDRRDHMGYRCVTRRRVPLRIMVYTRKAQHVGANLSQSGEHRRNIIGFVCVEIA